ncbi:hypothetical protein BLNAU_16072 [Blattamonas nauphoetae]|uniref:Uncharacterized protein n=1 Tax=Blattamonas nauphoetae TaxID=2049346 RepID=A0ABQ9X8P2_9EUKA|nr:hypothetical protein BLNAU_16072 [Blattamonas nauphoetae]
MRQATSYPQHSRPPIVTPVKYTIHDIPHNPPLTQSRLPNLSRLRILQEVSNRIKQRYTTQLLHQVLSLALCRRIFPKSILLSPFSSESHCPNPPSQFSVAFVNHPKFRIESHSAIRPNFSSAPSTPHISQRVTTSEFQLKLPRDLRFTAYEPHPFVDFDENDTFVPHFPSTDPLLITNIRRAGLIFLSLSDFVEEGHSFDDESLKKAILCLRIICNIQNMNDEKDRFTISHHELLRHIVPPTLDRTKLFLERVRILLSSPNATFIGSVLKLLEALLPRDEPGEAQAFWNSNIFSHLRISDADYEHISCTALISFLSFLSLQSFHLTNISIHTNHEAPPSDESAEKLLTEMLVPLKPLFLTLYRKRFQTENVIDNIRCPCVCLALLRDPFVTWKFHEATLHFVRSLPICLTILSVLIDHDKNREISNSLRHILCTFAPHSTVSSMRREKMLLTDMSSEGLDDEIELFVWTSERRLGIFETFTHIPVSSIACDLLRSLGGNSRFLFSD